MDYVIQAADVNCCHGNSALIVVTGLRLLELLATVPKKVCTQVVSDPIMII